MILTTKQMTKRTVTEIDYDFTLIYRDNWQRAPKLQARLNSPQTDDNGHTHHFPGVAYVVATEEVWSPERELTVYVKQYPPINQPC